MLPRQASEPFGALGVPPLSVLLIARVGPSRSTTAHHILVYVPAPRSAEGSAAAAVAHLLSRSPGNAASARATACAAKIPAPVKMPATANPPTMRYYLILASLSE